MTPTAWIGLLITIVSEAATLAHIEPFWSWNTPICWTGFILFADAVVFRATGRSWMRTSPREFVYLALLSIPFWLVFEFYNRFIDNWYYVGLPENAALRYFGYAWSFATIWPAIFEGADLVAVARGYRGGTALSVGGPWRPVPLFVSVIGVAMLAWPLVWPSRYLAAPVWLGFILLLDPINDRMGGTSFVRSIRDGYNDGVINLCASGFLCGFLWEFWNYWSRSKWHYTVPIMENVKLFEMPLPGFLGFPAFALECSAMYSFVRTAVRNLGRRITL